MEYINQMPCPMLVTDRDGVVREINSSLLHFAGHDEEYWLGRSIDSIFPLPSRIFLQTHMWPMLYQQGYIEEIKMEIVDLHGSRLPVLVNCQRTKIDGVESYCWVLFIFRERNRFEAELLDARKRSEESARIIEEREQSLVAVSRELLAAQEKVRLANESGGVGIWELNLLTGELVWDDLMYRLYGLQPRLQTDANELWTSHLHPDDKERAERAFERALSTGEDFFSEFRVLWADDSVHYLRGFGRIRKGDGGVAERIVGTNIDVTEAHLQALALKNALEEAELASQSKGQFLANMSHEIRTPMNAILGMLELLQNTNLTDRQRDYASKTDNAARSLLVLLNDILDFSKVDAGKMTLESEPFQIEKLLENLSTILSANVGGKDIEVLFDIDAALPSMVCGDAMRLLQVLINLGGNAVKFTAHGHVVLAMRILSRQDTSVIIHFAVKDTGIGIAPEHHAHIFSGFSQAEGSTTRRFGGTGLGLAICKRLVELMGGEIQIASALGAGSTFAFALEMQVLATTAEAQNEPDLALIPPQRVLVVDDDQIAGELTLRMVRSLGWTADLASSGKQALEMIAEQPNHADSAFAYAVIYMDWKMPDMDGWAATQLIREMARVSNLSQPLVVMITAHGRETLSLRTEAEQEMINGFLVKPVTASMLRNSLVDARAGNTSIRKLANGRNSARQLIGMRILVVEDNLINQQVADELLTAQGALVSLAANGQLGVDAVAAAAPQFDVVLMDVQMPVLDGYGATRVIRSELGLTNLPIVAMTANAMISDREACISAGMNEHIGKPFDIGKLVSLLIRITGLKPPFAYSDDPAVQPPELPRVPEILGLELQTALNRMSGMRSLYVRTARDLIRTMDTIIPELQQYLITGEKQKVIMRLHTLKGNAGTLGATELANKAGKLEKLCATGGGMQECKEGLDRFEILIRSTQKTLSIAIEAIDAQPAITPPLLTDYSGQPVSEAAIAALRRISELAKTFDMGALQEFDQATALLSALPAESTDALGLAFQELDFDKASNLIDEVLSGLVH